jgi:hypothetical protein
MTWEREGIPGVEGLAVGEKGGEALCRVGSKEVYVQGAMRLERSESGCPIVDISQLCPTSVFPLNLQHV